MPALVDVADRRILWRALSNGVIADGWTRM